MACPYWVRDWLGGCGLVCPLDLKRLAGQGVTLLVSLVEDDELLECWRRPEELVEEAGRLGVRVLRLPTPDLGAPDPDEACRAVEEAVREAGRGGRVVFHCYAGLGRTGTMLAAVLVAAECMDWQSAVEEVRKAEPAAGPQTPLQEYFLDYVERECRCKTGPKKGETAP